MWRVCGVTHVFRLSLSSLYFLLNRAALSLPISLLARSYVKQMKESEI